MVPPIRTTWELSPEWVQQLGKHHSVALRDAIIALKRDDSAFRQQVLEVGESRNERDRDTWIDWVFNFHDLCAAGEDTVKSQLVAQRTHEAYLSTLADLELWAVHQYGGVKHHVGAAQGGGGSLAVRLRDVLPRGALAPQIRRAARLLSGSEVQEALHELRQPEVISLRRLIALHRSSTSGELRQLVYTEMAKYDAAEAASVTSVDAWDRLVPPLCRFRVRAPGPTDQQRILLSPSADGSLPGDLLNDTDILCATPLAPPTCVPCCAVFLNFSHGIRPNFCLSRMARGSARQHVLCVGRCWSMIRRPGSAAVRSCLRI